MKEKIFVVFFTIMVMFLVISKVSADNSLSGDIADEESRVNDNENRLEEIQSQLSDLNASKDNLVEYLDNLNNSYISLASYIEELENQKEEKLKQIEEIDVELKRAEAEQTEQYENMKLRIQYMYENGESSYIMALFSEESLSTILNRIEYTAEIVEYDRKKLQEYEDMLTYIAAVRLELEAQVEELEALEQEQQNGQQQMAEMMSEAVVNISNKEAEIDEAEAAADELAKKIQAGKDSIEELKAEESRRVEESIRASIEYESKIAAGIYEEATTAPYYEATEDEVMMMAAILYCEARGEPYQGILAVGSVVMNRVDDPRFPNTIEGVIMSPGQFSPVASGLYAIALAKGANETCIQAAKEVLYDGVRIGPWLYFRTINGIIQGTEIGGHVFYYR